MIDDDYASPEEKRAKRRAEKLARAKQAQDDSVIRSLMSGPAGREYVNELLTFCKIWHTTFTGKALSGAFNEGQRSVGLKLFGDLVRSDPNALLLMLKENGDGGRPLPEAARDVTDWDDERNFDELGRWIGEGDGPDE